jgi:hypothetical protein
MQIEPIIQYNFHARSLYPFLSVTIRLFGWARPWVHGPSDAKTK